MKRGYAALLAAMVVPLSALTYAGCTVWNDAVVPNGGGGTGGSKTTSSSSTGNGGSGGGAAPETLLSLDDAAKGLRDGPLKMSSSRRR